MWIGIASSDTIRYSDIFTLNHFNQCITFSCFLLLNIYHLSWYQIWRFCHLIKALKSNQKEELRNWDYIFWPYMIESLNAEINENISFSSQLILFEIAILSHVYAFNAPHPLHLNVYCQSAQGILKCKTLFWKWNVGWV